VRCGEGCISLDITDTGVGFDPSTVLSSGLGLVSMRERVAILNGELAIERTPGGGTQVRVRIALGAASANAAASVAASKPSPRLAEGPD
jgi:signal transduction histidine kinase